MVNVLLSLFSPPSTLHLGVPLSLPLCPFLTHSLLLNSTSLLLKPRHLPLPLPSSSSFNSPPPSFRYPSSSSLHPFFSKPPLPFPFLILFSPLSPVCFPFPISLFFVSPISYPFPFPFYLTFPLFLPSSHIRLNDGLHKLVVELLQSGVLASKNDVSNDNNSDSTNIDYTTTTTNSNNDSDKQ